MKYYITTLEMASGINQIKAKLEGCNDTTLFWWVTITHPTTGQVALCVEDKECTPILTAANQLGIEVVIETARTIYETPTLKITTDSLFSHEAMEAEGWFANNFQS
jgi:hypothetical protein